MIDCTAGSHPLREYLGYTRAKPEQAAWNAACIRDLVAARTGRHLKLRVCGDCYLDLSSGPLVLEVGGPNQLSGLSLLGPGRLIGVGAPTATTPVIRLVRAPGRTPSIKLSNLAIESDGSGILCENGGALTRLSGLSFRGGSRGDLDLDGFQDVLSGRCGYALRVENSDGLFVRDLVIDGWKGHGVVSTRWHAGRLHGLAFQCGGVGAKLQQANGLDLRWRAEQNAGWGLYAQDCGVERYSGSSRTGNAGGPNRWWAWLEANNGRGITGGHGYRFSQFAMSNCARVTLDGHTGWRANQSRLDGISRYSNEFIEKVTVPSRAADRQLSQAKLPSDAPGNRRISNWHEIWPDEAYRPKAVRAGDGAVTIRWPVGSLDHTAKREVAYWRPFGLQTLSSPGAFTSSATVQDVNGAIADYCRRREAVSPCLTPIVAVSEISPVAGDLTGFPLWDSEPVTISGRIVIENHREDIGLSLNVYAPGMESQGVPQTAEHQLLLTAANVWKD